jgi:hypothetical protein
MHVSSIYIQTVCRLSLEAATLTVTVSRRRPAAAPPGSSWTAVAVCGRLSSTGGPRRRTGEFQALYDKRRSNSASVAGQTAHAACMPALGRSVNQVRPQQALDRPTVRSWSGPAPDCRDMPSSEGALDATNLEITRRTQPRSEVLFRSCNDRHRQVDYFLDRDQRIRVANATVGDRVNLP